MSPWLSWKSLCRPSWSQTHRVLSASAYWVLGLKAGATTTQRELWFLTTLNILYQKRASFLPLFLHGRGSFTSFIFLFLGCLIFRPWFNIFCLSTRKILFSFINRFSFFLWDIFFPSLFSMGKISWLSLFLYLEVSLFLFILSHRRSLKIVQLPLFLLTSI